MFYNMAFKKRMNQNRKMGQVGTKKGLLAKQLVAEEGIS